MKRKECEMVGGHRKEQGELPEFSHLIFVPTRPMRKLSRVVCLFSVFVALHYASAVRAGSIHLWPSSVVTEDSVFLADVAELRGFDAETEQKLGRILVSPSPVFGGSRVIGVDLVRSALAAGGANLASVTMHGATQTAISRPASSHSIQAGEPTDGRTSATGKPPIRTLRQAVLDAVNSELAVHGGTAEIVFDKSSQHALELSGPNYEFSVRRLGNSLLGLNSFEVEVQSNGRTPQTVALVAQLSMNRPAVFARRAINQGAAIVAADVEVKSMTYNRLDKLGVEDPAKVIGQRAKRFIPSGTVIESLAWLETVPLVVRGNLVTLVSTIGGISVVTSGKAGNSGVLGESVKVQPSGPASGELEGIIIGPGKVSVGTLPLEPLDRPTQRSASR